MWDSPTEDAIFDAIDATWSPSEIRSVGDWVLRKGNGGGSRVSAAGYTGAPDGPFDIDQAVSGMASFNQRPLFMLRDKDVQLDETLASLGYNVLTPVRILGGDVTVAMGELGKFAIPCATRLAIQEEIWLAGEIGPQRWAVMDRVTAPKSFLLARSASNATATGFAAVHNGIGMLHALEVRHDSRRQGYGDVLTRAAATWCFDNGAKTFAVLVTRANLAAIELYERLGMADLGAYHYRAKNQ